MCCSLALNCSVRFQESGMWSLCWVMHWECLWHDHYTTADFSGCLPLLRCLAHHKLEQNCSISLEWNYQVFWGSFTKHSSLKVREEMTDALLHNWFWIIPQKNNVNETLSWLIFVGVLIAGKRAVYDWRGEAEGGTSSWAGTPGVDASEAACAGNQQNHQRAAREREIVRTP